MLRKLRIALATLMLAGITLLFMGIGQNWWGWMADIQFLPSAMRALASATLLNVLAVAFILALTLLFGRIYCSVICPMGIFQDLVIAIRRLFGKPKVKFRKENAWLRYTVFCLFWICAAFHIQALVVLLAPYSAYGRMVRALASTWMTGAFGGPAAPVTGVLVLVAALTFAVIVLLSVLFGREWCNSVCPVGTLLGFVSRFSFLRPTIDKDTCISCGKCERQCRAACIDSRNKTIDYSRCVDCFDCIDSCPKSSLKYRSNWGVKAETSVASSSSRRNFLKTGALVLGSAVAGEKALQAVDIKTDGGLAPVLPKQNPVRSERLVPPGAGSVRNFYDRCTACQLCVSACPNGVLRASADMEHLLQPQMGYEKGYCRPECNACSQVCPAGAILPIEKEEKSAVHIGRASVNLELCVSAQGVICGNCAHHCPSGAIIMVRTEDGRSIPSVVESMCIGCGACEYLCPSRPISAITVNGLSSHITE